MQLTEQCLLLSSRVQIRLELIQVAQTLMKHRKGLLASNKKQSQCHDWSKQSKLSTVASR